MPGHVRKKCSFLRILLMRPYNTKENDLPYIIASMNVLNWWKRGTHNNNDTEAHQITILFHPLPLSITPSNVDAWEEVFTAGTNWDSTDFAYILI